MECIIDGCKRNRQKGALMRSLHMYSVPRDDARGETPRERVESLAKDWKKAVEDAKNEYGS